MHGAVLKIQRRTSANRTRMNHPYAAVREAMRHDSPFWRVEHVDITCDGCECEPIIGKR